MFRTRCNLQAHYTISQLKSVKKQFPLCKEYQGSHLRKVDIKGSPKLFELTEITYCDPDNSSSIQCLRNFFTYLCSIEDKKDISYITGKHTGEWVNEEKRLVFRRKHGTEQHKGFFENSESAKVSFDIDGIPIVFLTTSPISSARNILMEMFRSTGFLELRAMATTAMIAQFSASTGTKRDSFGLHVDMMLDQPRSEDEFRAWVKARAAEAQAAGTMFLLDPAYHNSVQLHFTAAPLFTHGAVDPVKGPRIEISVEGEHELETEFLDTVVAESQVARAQSSSRRSIPRLSSTVSMETISESSLLTQLLDCKEGTGTHDDFLRLTWHGAVSAMRMHDAANRERALSVLVEVADRARPGKGRDAVEGAVSKIEFNRQQQQQQNTTTVQQQPQTTGAADVVEGESVNPERVELLAELNKQFDDLRVDTDEVVRMKNSKLPAARSDYRKLVRKAHKLAERVFRQLLTEDQAEAADNMGEIQTHVITNTFTPQAGGKYLPDAVLKDLVPSGSSRDLVAIKSSTGTGKTTLIKKLVYVLKTLGLTLSYVTSRRSLAKQAAISLSAESYEDIQGDIKPEEHPFLVVVALSVHRIVGTYDIMVYDEVEQIDSLAFDRRMNKGNIAKTEQFMLTLSHKAKKIILLDATLEDSTVEAWAKKAGLKKDAVTVINHKYVKDVPVNYFGDSNMLMREVYAFLGLVSAPGKVFSGKAPEQERLAIMCSTKEMADRVANIVEKAGIPYINYTSDTQPYLKDTLNAVNRSWLDYRVVIASPSISSGVSFDLPDIFHLVVFADYNPGYPAEDILQQRSRIRHPLSVSMYVSPRMQHPISEEEALSSVEDEVRRTIELNERHEIASPLKLDEDGKIVAADEGILRRDAAIRAKNSRRSSTNLKSLILYDITSGAKVNIIPPPPKGSLEDDDLKTFKKHTAEVKKAVLEAKIKAIYSAPDISVEEARVYKEKKKQGLLQFEQVASMSGTSQQDLAATKAFIFNKMKRFSPPQNPTEQQIKAINDFNEETIKMSQTRGFEKRYHLIKGAMTAAYLGGWKDLEAFQLSLDNNKSTVFPVDHPLGQVKGGYQILAGERSGLDVNTVASLLSFFENEYDYSFLNDFIKPILETGIPSQKPLPRFISKELDQKDALFDQVNEYITDPKNAESLKRLGLPRKLTKLASYLWRILDVIGIPRRNTSTKLGGVKVSYRTLDATTYLSRYVSRISEKAKAFAEHIELALPLYQKQHAHQREVDRLNAAIKERQARMEWEETHPAQFTLPMSSTDAPIISFEGASFSNNFRQVADNVYQGAAATSAG